ncbi:MAG: hypothetical protein OEW67_02395 [Cyclobacteriaceae bacterium]|nr:hypothetical protein [Cyclobacteriaceae bacterium]
MSYYIDNTTGYKLKIDSKKLCSGKHQVRFQTQNDDEKSKYGYVLADEGSSLKEVIEQIRMELLKMKKGDFYFHSHLYSLGKEKQHSNVFVFEY